MKSIKKLLKTNKNNKYRPNKRLRYNNNYSYRINKYQNSTRPTTFGPGQYKLCVSKIISGALNTQVQIPLYSEILINNPEFERIQNDFKYFKINNISITFYPRNIQRLDDSNLTPCYMAMVYDAEVIENLRLQDTVKVIPAFFTRRKIFKYNIPYFEAGSGLLNAWTDRGSLGKYENIVLQLHAPDNTNQWYIRYDANITCRGPTSHTVTTRFEEIKSIKWEKEKELEKYDELINKLKEKIKEKEEIDEEDKEEELKNSDKPIQCEKAVMANVTYMPFFKNIGFDQIRMEEQGVQVEDNEKDDLINKIKKEKEILEIKNELNNKNKMKYEIKKREKEKEINELIKILNKLEENEKKKDRIIEDKNQLIKENYKIIDKLANELSKSSISSRSVP